LTPILDKLLEYKRKWIQHVRGCADKSLARPARKKATVIKLGIYSNHEAQCAS